MNSTAEYTGEGSTQVKGVHRGTQAKGMRGAHRGTQVRWVCKEVVRVYREGVDGPGQ